MLLISVRNFYCLKFSVNVMGPGASGLLRCWPAEYLLCLNPIFAYEFFSLSEVSLWL